jgi:hypothetical protein
VSTQIRKLPLEGVQPGLQVGRFGLQGFFSTIGLGCAGDALRVEEGDTAAGASPEAALQTAAAGGPSGASPAPYPAGAIFGVSGLRDATPESSTGSWAGTHGSCTVHSWHDDTS